MNRIEELNKMKGPQLIKEADKIGVKVKCDKARTKLVEKKSDLVERIIAFEAQNAAEKLKKPNLRIREITYKGKTQSIKDWADEIGIPRPTLYDRINRNGWTVEEAIEIPLGQRRK